MAEKPVTIAHLRENGGALGEAVNDLVRAAYERTTLDARTRELIFVAIGSAVHMPASIVAHAQRAHEVGCTRQEIIDAIMMGSINGGINGALDGLPAALAKLDALEADAPEAAAHPHGGGVIGGCLTAVALIDRLALEDRVSGFLSTVDEKRWPDIALHCMSDGELVLYSGGDRAATISGVPAIVAFYATAHERLTRTQHMITNVRTRVDGETAEVDGYLHVTHNRGGDPRDHWEVGGRCRFECRRGSHEWQCARVTLWTDWRVGGPSGSFGQSTAR